MDLTDREIRELALFFAKRMDTSLNLLDPLDPPPPGDPRQDWFDTLIDARDSGGLERLVSRIGRVAPDDENLQSACEILVTRGAHLQSLALGATLVGGTGILLVSIAATAGILAAAAVVGETETLVEVRPAPIERVQVAAIDVEPPEEVSYDEPEIVVAPVEVAAAVEAPAAPPFQRCLAGSGEVVGYWYAGDEAPGIAGQTVTVAHSINVRADYPDIHNNFNARAHITCVLHEGDVVHLSRDPILAPGDRYWIPLISGDLRSS